MDSDYQIRDLFHLISSEDLTANQIKLGFGPIKLSQDSINNQLVTQEIVSQVQSVKSPFFGSPLPGSFVIVSTVGDVGIVPVFTPVTNKTYCIEAASCTNIGPSGTIDIEFGYTDGALFVLVSKAQISAGITSAFDTRGYKTFESNVFPAFIITSGTAGDAEVNMAYAEVVQ